MRKVEQYLGPNCIDEVVRPGLPLPGRWYPGLVFPERAHRVVGALRASVDDARGVLGEFEPFLGLQPGPLVLVSLLGSAVLVLLGFPTLLLYRPRALRELTLDRLVVVRLPRGGARAEGLLVLARVALLDLELYVFGPETRLSFLLGLANRAEAVVVPDDPMMIRQLL